MENEDKNTNDTTLITYNSSGIPELPGTHVRKILGVSPKTWQNYRDRRIIPFSQIGRKIYVNRADLDAFLRNQHIAARK